MLEVGMATNLPFLFAQLRFWIVVLVCLLTSLSAQAPPGHEDGGDFTWTYEHAVRHPWATFVTIAVAGLLAWGLVRMLRQAQPALKAGADRNPAVGTLS
jgi:hypothetical protein